MGLANSIDPHRKSTLRFTKSASLMLIRLVLTEIQRFKNIKNNKEMYDHLDTVSDSGRMAIHFFVNFSNYGCILLTIGSTYTKLKDFVKLGLHFLTNVCGSIVVNPIIYRLIPSPSLFENMQ